MTTHRPLLTTLILLIIISLPLMAENNDESYIERSWDFALGLGYGKISNPFVNGREIPLYATADVAIYGDRFFFDNGDLGFTLIDQPNFGLNLITTYNTERIYYSYFNNLGLIVFNGGGGNIQAINENPLLDIGARDLEGTGLTFDLGINILHFGLPKRDFSLNFGIEALYQNTFGAYSLQVTKNIDGNHNGTEARFEYSKSWGYKKWSFGTSLGLHWKSSKLINYYYGFENQYGPLLDFSYKAQSGFDTLAWLHLSYQINNNWSLVGNLKYSFLSDSIKDSPLIDSSKTRSRFVGLAYRF